MGKGPRPHKLASLHVAFECPHGPHLLGHSPGARMGPLSTPEPGGLGAPGLDLGRGTLRSHSRDLEQVSHALGDPAVDGLRAHRSRAVGKAVDGRSSGRSQ